MNGEQAEDQGERSRSQRDREPRHTAAVRLAQRVAPARPALRLRSCAVRCLLGVAGRQGDQVVRDAGGRRQRQGDHDARGPAGCVGEVAWHDRCGAGGAASAAAGVDRRAGAPLRLLPERNDDPGGRPAGDDQEADRGADPDGDERSSLPLRDVSENPDGDPEGRRRDGERWEVAMTEMLKKEFSRKSFVKGGGALVVGFSVGAAAFGSGKAQGAAAATVHGVAGGPLPLNQLDTWIAIHADNTATVYTGRIEMGQGTGTSWRQITAEELDVSYEQVRFVQPDTHSDPDTGGTNGSTSVQVNGPRVRSAAAYARQALLGLASASLGVPVASLTVDKGIVSGGGRSVTYGALIGDKLFNVTVPTATLDPGQGIAKPVSQYKLVGKRIPRFDIPEKVTGSYTYVHHIRLPGMLHGRIVRMRGQGEYGVPIKPLAVDESSIKHISGVQVLRKGDFIGVVAAEEYAAVQAAAQLKVTWQTTPSLPSNGNLHASMRAIATSDRVLTQRGDMSAGFAKAAQILTASYQGPYQVHGSIGPSAAVAQIGPGGGTVFSNSNYAYRMRGKIATMLGLDPATIRVRYYEGASNFGKCPYDDTTEAAALMSSMLGGTPVRVQFMRWDEHGWDNYGPAQSMDIRAGIDAS